MTGAIALLGEYTPTFPPHAATESHYCDFVVNPDYLDDLRRGPLRTSGSDGEGGIRVIEYPGHPFFIGTLFVPQARSRPAAPHPLITAFLRAAIDLATPAKENTP
jgi:CTP synthase (UTP-ammonia lyase)